MQSTLGLGQLAGSFNAFSLVDKTRKFVEDVADPDKLLGENHPNLTESSSSASKGENVADEMLSPPRLAGLASQKFQSLTTVAATNMSYLASPDLSLAKVSSIVGSATDGLSNLSVASLMESARNNLTDISDLDSMQARQEVKQLLEADTMETTSDVTNSPIAAIAEVSFEGGKTQQEPNEKLQHHTRFHGSDIENSSLDDKQIETAISTQEEVRSKGSDIYMIDPLRVHVDQSKFRGRYSNNPTESRLETVSGKPVIEKSQTGNQNIDSPVAALQEALALLRENCNQITLLRPGKLLSLARANRKLTLVVCLASCILFATLLFVVGIRVSQDESAVDGIVDFIQKKRQTVP